MRNSSKKSHPTLFSSSGDRIGHVPNRRTRHLPPYLCWPFSWYHNKYVKEKAIKEEPVYDKTKWTTNEADCSRCIIRPFGRHRFVFCCFYPTHLSKGLVTYLLQRPFSIRWAERIGTMPPTMDSWSAICSLFSSSKKIQTLKSNFQNKRRIKKTGNAIESHQTTTIPFLKISKTTFAKTWTILLFYDLTATTTI